MSELERPVSAKPVRWYFNTKFVWLMLFIFGPFALPLVWFSPKFTRTWKIVVTILAVIITVLLWKTTAMMFKILNERLKDIQSASVM